MSHEGCIAITEMLLQETGLEDWSVEKARANLLNLTDTIFADGTWWIEPDCVEWSQLGGDEETGRGEHGEFNFRCDAIISVMSGDRERATPVIEKLTLNECVELTECVLRYWLCTFLSQPTNWEECHMDVIDTIHGFKYAARQVFELPKRMPAGEIIRQFSQEELPGLNVPPKVHRKSPRR